VTGPTGLRGRPTRALRISVAELAAIITLVGSPSNASMAFLPLSSKSSSVDCAY